jgi:D-inositol-3-phosphate glycosyltransferase
MNVYVRELTRQLGAMGVHVDVFTRSQDEHVPHVLHDLGYGNRVVHIPAGPEVPLPKEELAAHIPEYVERILTFTSMKGIHYDLIHSHYWMSGIAGRDLRQEWRIPMIQMFHTLGLMKRRIAREGEGVDSGRISGEQQILQTADRIVAATQAEMAQLQWLYQADTQKVVIIPPGVDLSHFYPIPSDEAKEFVGVPPEDHMVLFVGRIEPLKGVDTLLQALILMREAGVLKRHHICLAIIGGEPYGENKEKSAEMGRLQSLRVQHDLEDMVAFLGRRSQDTLPYYYSAAELVVMPSHYESFGMVALESMSCGTPVVASQVGGLAFLIQDGDTGFLVPDQDPEALARRMTDLIERADLRDAMGERAANYATQYAWEKIAVQIARLYEDVISASLQPAARSGAL